MFKYRLSKNLRDLVTEKCCPSVEYLQGFNDKDLSEQSDIDGFIDEFIKLIQNLSDKDAQKILGSAKLNVGLSKESLASYLAAITPGITLWNSVIPPIFNVIHNLKPEDYVNRTEAFEKSGKMIEDAKNAFWKWTTVPGIGKFPMPKWSSMLERVIKTTLQNEMRRRDNESDDKTLTELGYTSKTDLLLIPAAMKEFFASSGKCFQFKKHVREVVKEDKIEELYRGICKLDHNNDDQDDLDYGISHYGALGLLSEALDRLTYHSVQEYMYGPEYLTRDASKLATVVKKLGQSILGRIFGK